MNDAVLATQEQQVLYDRKWIIFLRRTGMFRHIPFVEFALAAGSMALGNVHKDSDFDVIVGVRAGRIFTARFFSVLFFGALGWRRKKLTHHEAASNKVCLNHFVTAASYALSPPHSPYWKALYQSLVPVYGADQPIQKFFAANADWAGARAYQDDLRHRYQRGSHLKRILETIFSGFPGRLFEALFRRVQVRRIERGLQAEAGYKPRIVYGDTELEFHPDTSRVAALDRVWYNPRR